MALLDQLISSTKSIIHHQTKQIMAKFLHSVCVCLTLLITLQAHFAWALHVDGVWNSNTDSLKVCPTWIGFEIVTTYLSRLDFSTLWCSENRYSSRWRYERIRVRQRDCDKSKLTQISEKYLDMPQWSHLARQSDNVQRYPGTSFEHSPGAKVSRSQPVSGQKFILQWSLWDIPRIEQRRREHQIC